MTLYKFFCDHVIKGLQQRVMSIPQDPGGGGGGGGAAPGGGGAGGRTNLGDSVSEKDTARKGLIGLNNLNYRLEPDMSVAVNCTDKNHFFAQQTYTNTQRAVCVLNSGADYIDTRRSFLNFTIELPNNEDELYGHWTGDPLNNAEQPLPETISFGKPRNSNNPNHAQPHYDGASYHGSAMNLIERITISTRSGDEVSRIERANLLSYHLEPWKHDQEWIDTIGQGMGMGRTFQLTLLKDSNYVNDSFKKYAMRVSIPLPCLSPFFNYPRLMPAMLMSGLRIEIQWASPNSSFCRSIDVTDNRPAASTQNDILFPINYQANIAVTEIFNLDGTAPNHQETIDTAASRAIVSKATISGYELKDIYFQLKSVQLTDSVQRILNETSAVNGLEIVYSDYQNTQAVQNDQSGQMYIEVRHAASRAQKAIAIPRIQIAAELPTSDSFASTGHLFTSWQYRLGSLYFPHQAIKSDTALDNIPQTYYYTADAFGKIGTGSRPSIGMLQYLSEYEKAMHQGVEYSTVRIDDVSDSVHSIATHELEFNERYPLYGIGTTHWLQHNRFMGMAPIAVSLERSTLFNLSGIPINNSRVLSFNATFEKGGAGTVQPSYGPITVDIYLEYVRLARVFLNNVEIEQ